MTLAGFSTQRRDEGNASPLIELTRATKFYGRRPVLSEVSLLVESGTATALIGRNGSGKSTLLSILAGLTKISSGTLVRYERRLTIGYAPEAFPGLKLPAEQYLLCMGKLAGLTCAAAEARVTELLRVFHLEDFRRQSMAGFSKGMLQKVNLIQSLLTQPQLLLLDEPTSQLDPVAAREFLQTLHRLNEEMSVTVIISEHRLEEVLPLADRVLLLEEGVLRFQGTPRDFVCEAGQEDHAPHMAYLPTAARLFLTLEPDAVQAPRKSIPLTVREGKRWLHALAAAGEPGMGTAATGASNLSAPASESELLLSCREVTFRYSKDGAEVLKKLSLSLYRGELLAVMGGNGAGKSTLLHVLNGLLKPQRGKVTLAKGVTSGFLAQNPLLYFSYDTVQEELQQMAEYAGLTKDESGREIARLLEIFQLGGILPSHPHDISGGQQQKLALAMVMLLGPGILLLDEPTKGLDPGAKERLAALLGDLRRQGVSILLVTHDVEFAARYASRCAMLFDGGITSEGTPEEFFSSNYFYTTAVNRMARELLPQALTIEDVMNAWSAFASRS